MKLISTLLAALALALPASGAALVNAIEVVVHDAVITRLDVFDYSEPAERELYRDLHDQPEVLDQRVTEARRDSLDHLIERQLILHEFKTASLTIPEKYIDDAVRASGLGWTLLQPNSFMQNHITFNTAAIRSGAFYAPHGEGATALIDVRDIAEVAALVLADPSAHQGQTYVLTGAQSLTDAEQAAILTGAIGRPVAYVDVPEAAASEAMAGMGFPALLVDWLMSLNAIVKAGYAAGQSPEVQRLTGHAPRSFESFAQEHRAVWA